MKDAETWEERENGIMDFMPAGFLEGMTHSVEFSSYIEDE